MLCDNRWPFLLGHFWAIGSNSHDVIYEWPLPYPIQECSQSLMKWQCFWSKPVFFRYIDQAKESSQRKSISLRAWNGCTSQGTSAKTKYIVIIWILDSWIPDKTRIWIVQMCPVVKWSESRARRRATQQGYAKCGGTSPCQRSWHRKKFRRKVDN